MTFLLAKSSMSDEEKLHGPVEYFSSFGENHLVNLWRGLLESDLITNR